MRQSRASRNGGNRNNIGARFFGVHLRERDDIAAFLIRPRQEVCKISAITYAELFELSPSRFTDARQFFNRCFQSIIPHTFLRFRSLFILLHSDGYCKFFLIFGLFLAHMRKKHAAEEIFLYKRACVCYNK